MSPHPPLHWLRAFWQTRPPSERRWLGALLALVVLLLVGRWGVAPALRQLQSSQIQTPLLDAQYLQMLHMQQQAQALQAQPQLTRAQALRLLYASLDALGSQAQTQVQGAQITVRFQAATPETLLMWLNQVRLDARLTPSQVHWVRRADARWDASVVIDLHTP
jgi:general secretion pathway protein M